MSDLAPLLMLLCVVGSICLGWARDPWWHPLVLASVVLMVDGALVLVGHGVAERPGLVIGVLLGALFWYGVGFGARALSVRVTA